MSTIEAEVPLTKEEIAVLARVLSAIDATRREPNQLQVLHHDDLIVTEDEDRAFVSARTKIVQLAR